MCHNEVMATKVYPSKELSDKVMRLTHLVGLTRAARMLGIDAGTQDRIAVRMRPVRVATLAYVEARIDDALVAGERYEAAHASWRTSAPTLDE